MKNCGGFLPEGAKSFFFVKNKMHLSVSHCVYRQAISSSTILPAAK